MAKRLAFLSLAFLMVACQGGEGAATGTPDSVRSTSTTATAAVPTAEPATAALPTETAVAPTQTTASTETAASIEAVVFQEVVSTIPGDVPQFGSMYKTKMTFADISETARNLDHYQLSESNAFDSVGQFVGSPDGSKIVFVGNQRIGGMGLFVWDFTEQQIVSIPSEMSGLSYLTAYRIAGPPAWSPDSQTLFFSVNVDEPGSNNVFNRNIYRWKQSDAGLSAVTDAVAISSSTNQVVMDLAPSVSPDGKFIAFVRYAGDDFVSPAHYHGSLFIKNLANDSERLLVESIYIFEVNFYELQGGGGPVWSPDGRWIAYAAGDTYPRIGIVDVQTGESHWLTNGTASESDPIWSPDGKSIVYTSNHDGNPDIYRVNLDGSSSINLTHNPANDYWPTWSPSGNYIVFASDRDDIAPGYKLFATNSEGSGYRLVSPAYVLQPATWVRLPVP